MIIDKLQPRDLVPDPAGAGEGFHACHFGRDFPGGAAQGCHSEGSVHDGRLAGDDLPDMFFPDGDVAVAGLLPGLALFQVLFAAPLDVGGN